jgi:hypothetical protein
MTERNCVRSRRGVIWLIACLCSIVILQPCRSLGWGQGHRLIREWAEVRLPDWQRELIGAENLRRLCVDYKSLQDTHAGGKAPHLDPYCKDHGLRISLHDVNPIEKSVDGMLWYLDKITSHMRAGETDEAMKFLGVLCHWNEDPGCPSAHSSPISEAELKILIPPPPDRARYNYLFGAGGIADIGKYALADEPYTPKLLGRTREEIAMQIYQRQRLLERNAAAHIVPLVQDMMHGDGTKAARHRADAALYNAKHIADVIHTIICLAAKRFDGGAKLDASQPLTEWLPDPMGRRPGHPYYVTGFLMNQAMDANRNQHPLAFAGPGKTSQIAQGFGTGAPFAINYTLAPGGVYRRFTCRVGLHKTAGANGEVAFAILINGKEVKRTKPLGPNNAPEKISIELPSDKIVRLSLVTIPTDPADSLSNLVVWGDPTLEKH